MISILRQHCLRPKFYFHASSSHLCDRARRVKLLSSEYTVAVALYCPVSNSYCVTGPLMKVLPLNYQIKLKCLLIFITYVIEINEFRHSNQLSVILFVKNLGTCWYRCQINSNAQIALELSSCRHFFNIDQCDIINFFST